MGSELLTNAVAIPSSVWQLPSRSSGAGWLDEPQKIMRACFLPVKPVRHAWKLELLKPAEVTTLTSYWAALTCDSELGGPRPCWEHCRCSNFGIKIYLLVLTTIHHHLIFQASEIAFNLQSFDSKTSSSKTSPPVDQSTPLTAW